MVKLNMPFPKTCQDCYMFEFEGDYPTCRATLSPSSPGYNFPYRDKRMSFCPLTEAPDSPKIYLVVIGENPNMHVLRAFLDKKKAERSAKNTEGARVETYLCCDPMVTLSSESVENYCVILSATGDIHSVAHNVKNVSGEESNLTSYVSYDDTNNLFICMIYNIDEKEEAVEEALHLRRKWISDKYGV